MINLKFNVTDENIDDIVATALEGGINYWCDRAKVKDKDYKGAEYASDVVSKGGTLLLINDMDEDGSELSKESLIAGVQMYMEKNGADIIDFEAKEIDCGNVDAEVADIIIQYAVFKELVYS